MKTVTARATATGGGIGTGVLLRWASAGVPSPPRSPSLALTWLATTTPDRILVALAVYGAWLCVLWLGISAVLCAAAEVPGRLGTVSGAVAVRLSPGIVRRAVRAVLGAALAGSLPVLAQPGLAAGASPTTPAGSGSHVATWPDLDRPVERPGHGIPLRTSGTGKRARHRGAAASPLPEIVMVRRGDSLWAISRRGLDPGAADAEIATAWPRWYAANRRVIGDDPNLLRPGQRLRAPH